MGMFDYVNYECTCPVCKSKVSGFQSKSSDCVLGTLLPQQVNNFYSSCDKCGCWIEFERIPRPEENFTLSVVGKKGKVLEEYTKDVCI